MRQRIYIPNKSGHDFTAAEKFGDLIFMTEGFISRFAVNEVYRAFSDIMADSHEDDWLLPSGYAFMNQVAGAIFAKMHGRLNLLLFDPSTGEYISRSISIDNLI